MPLPPRCLVADVELPELVVDRDGVHHFERVLRLTPGEAIELVDGRGGLALARWGRRGVLTHVELAPRAAPPAGPFVLAVAPPRPSRLDWLVEKAAELGVVRLQLLKTQHGAREIKPSRLARLQRKAGEALLQCRRLHIMEVAEARSLAEVLSQWSGPRPWLASPAAAIAPLSGAGSEAAPLLGLVGPEGGWHQDELTLARSSGAQPVGLGSGVLRVETAALALAVLAARRSPDPSPDPGNNAPEQAPR